MDDCVLHAPVIAGTGMEWTIVIAEQQYLTRAEAAEFLLRLGYKTAKATLAQRAVAGGGPPFVSWGRQPLYR